MRGRLEVWGGSLKEWLADGVFKLGMAQLQIVCSVE